MKNSLLVDKSRMSLAMGIAFVAFTTQFGGGFASGAQIYQYFINYGIWCLILPVLTQGLYLVRHALCLQAQDLRLPQLFGQSLRQDPPCDE